MTQIEEVQGRVGELKKSIEKLKVKIDQTKKSKTDDSSSIVKIRSWRKSVKKAQRKIRFLTGKKLAAKKLAKKEE